jgi:hypothetical protein
MKSFDVSDEKTPLTAAIRHLAEQERRTPAEHATPGELAAYHEGTLAPEIEARVREHLAHCRTCSDLLLDLAGFADLTPPPGIPELTDAEVERDWQALRARLGKGREQKEPATVVPFRQPAAPVKPSREFSPWKIAAAVLIAVGLSAGVMVLRQGASDLKPKASSIAEFSDGDQMRGSEPGKEQRMASSQPANFAFHTFDSYPKYQGEIVADGTVVWQTAFNAGQTSDQPESALKEVSFRVPEDSLKPGRYEARLFGIGADGGRELVGSLEFEVDAP